MLPPLLSMQFLLAGGPMVCYACNMMCACLCYRYNGLCIYRHVGNIDIDMLPPLLSMQFLLAYGVYT